MKIPDLQRAPTILETVPKKFLMNEETTNSEKNIKKKKTLDKEYSEKDIHNDLRNNFAHEKNLIPSINNLYNPYPKFSDDDIEKKIKDSKNNEIINYIEEPCYNTFNEHRSEHKIINRKKNNEENKNKKLEEPGNSKMKTKHKHRKIKVEIIKLGGHDDEDELIYNEDIIFNFMNKDNIKNKKNSKEKNISNKEYQINDDQSSLSNVSFSNKNIDTNNHSYHHRKQHNNNNDIIIKNLQREKEQLRKENKRLSQNFSNFEKEKQKFELEKKLFFDSRNRVIADSRKNEERLIHLENELENKYLAKKKEIQKMRNKIREEQLILENERNNMKNNYQLRLSKLEEDYKIKEETQNYNNNLNIEKTKKEQEILQQKEKEINELKKLFIEKENELNLKEEEFFNKQNELQQKEEDLNNKYQNLIEKEKNFLKEKQNFMNGAQENQKNFDIKAQELYNREKLLVNRETIIQNKEKEMKNRENQLSETKNKLYDQSYELNDKENKINLLDKEIKDKQNQIIELNNKYNDIMSKLSSPKTQKNNLEESKDSQKINYEIDNKDRRDNDSYPENNLKDIKDNDDFPENHLHDIEDNDDYPENNGEDDFIYGNNNNFNNNNNAELEEVANFDQYIKKQSLKENQGENNGMEPYDFEQENNNSLMKDKNMRDTDVNNAKESLNNNDIQDNDFPMNNMPGDNYNNMNQQKDTYMNNNNNNMMNDSESGEINLENLHKDDLDIDASQKQDNIDKEKNENNINNHEDEINDITEELYIEEYNPSLGLIKSEYPKYLNSLIQCFAHIPDITDKIINLHLDPNFNSNLSVLPLTKNYRNLLIHLFFPEKVYNMEHQAYNPIYFNKSIQEINPLFKDIENIEIKEFINYFILKLHDELNIKKNISSISEEQNDKMELKSQGDVLVDFLKNFTTKNNSVISKTLYGITKYTLYCHQCQNTFYNFQCYSYLYFNVDNVVEYKTNKYHRDDVDININDCLDYYKKSQTLIGDKGIFCPTCKSMTESTSIKNIYSTKNVLIIILDRNVKNKFNNKKIEISENINLRDYVEYRKEGEKNREKFYLCGAINYYLGDNGDNGTYNAFVKMGKNNDWYCYDNEDIYTVNFNDIINNGFPVVLFYHKLIKK